ncbi:MAG TPA: NAD-dependent epimerase/dehydratase family protein [Myxococcales bacterium]|nr:NAD-dependent epimerase/dehydratase family protein [Myxococcales bacterium]
MRVAVTGGSGQLGTLVLRRLADNRSIKEIVALDLRPPLVVSGKLRDVRADVRDPAIGRHLSGCDALVHLAFLVGKRGARALQDDVNVRGSANVFRAAVAAGVRRIVYASSVAAYGLVPSPAVPVSEEAPRTRQNGFWYAAAKFDVEQDLDALEREHPALAVTRLRPAILIGRRMEHRLGALMRRGLLPDAALPVVWDEDVADAVMLALQSGARGAFNLAADDPLPARELARAAGLRAVRLPRRLLAAVEKVVTALRILPPADPGWSSAGSYPLVYTAAKARASLGWKPRCPTALEVMRRYAEEVPRKLDRRIALFVRAADHGSRGQPPRPELKDYRSVIHLDLTSPSGGDVTLRVADGRLRLSLGAPRPAQAAVTMKAATLLDLLSGRTDVASAQLTGKMRVEGQGHASLVVGGLVGGFRSAARLPGYRGVPARALAKWIGS